MASVSARDRAGGFSQKVVLPRAAAASTRSLWVLVGLAMTTASTFLSSRRARGSVVPRRHAQLARHRGHRRGIHVGHGHEPGLRDAAAQVLRVDPAQASEADEADLQGSRRAGGGGHRRSRRDARILLGDELDAHALLGGNRFPAQELHRALHRPPSHVLGELGHRGHHGPGCDGPARVVHRVEAQHADPGPRVPWPRWPRSRPAPSCRCRRRPRPGRDGPGACSGRH